MILKKNLNVVVLKMLIKKLEKVNNKMGVNSLHLQWPNYS